MSFKIDTTVEPAYIRISGSGEYEFEKLAGFIAFIRTESDRVGLNRALVDCIGITGNMTEAERFQGGQKMAEVFGPRLKVALLMPTQAITHLGELAARNRGARVMVTSEESVALEWLLGDA